MQLNLGDEREGRIRKRVVVVVKGYDVSVPEGCTPRKRVLRLESMLRDHFSSCGKIKSVRIPHPYYSSAINRFAYIYIWGEGAREKALQLSGSELDGHKLVVTAPLRPFKRTLRKALNSAKSDQYCRSKLMIVKGYDPSLPRKFIKKALSKKFSSCGQVLKVDIHSHERRHYDTNGTYAFVSIYGEGAKEKSLQLNGCYMGGFQLDVDNAFRLKPPEDRVKPRSRLIPLGFPPLSERLGNPNWREKYWSRSRDRTVKKEEEDCK